VEELEVSEHMSFYDELLARSINVLRAGQYGQVEEARAQYMELLSRYEPLAEADKELVYPFLQWLFTSVKFESEITGVRAVKKLAAA
jgi:hypothetical protein